MNMKKQLNLYILLSLMISSSIYPISKTDRRILRAAEMTGSTIAGVLSYLGIRQILKEDDDISIALFAIMGGVVAALPGTSLGHHIGKTYLKRKYGVSPRVFNVALQYGYDLSTDQKLILQAAEQKNNPIIKKYLTDIFQKHFGENSIEKIESIMHEFLTLNKMHKPFAEFYKMFIEKVGANSATLLALVILFGLLPIAILYFDLPVTSGFFALRVRYSLEGQIRLAQDLMEAVELKNK